ncbi:hypothetical protein AXA44_22735 [Rhodococcus sp. SC4]|nr:hypothetical protein AXA44_22735 [Rhodococcus sp. SC4]
MSWCGCRYSVWSDIQIQTECVFDQRATATRGPLFGKSIECGGIGGDDPGKRHTSLNLSVPSAARLRTCLAPLEQSSACLRFCGAPVALKFAGVPLNSVEDYLPIGTRRCAVTLSFLERELAQCGVYRRGEIDLRRGGPDRHRAAVAACFGFPTGRNDRL